MSWPRFWAKTSQEWNWFLLSIVSSKTWTRYLISQIHFRYCRGVNDLYIYEKSYRYIDKLWIVRPVHKGIVTTLQHILHNKYMSGIALTASICLSVSVYQYLSLSVSLSISIYLCLSVYQYLSLSVYLSISIYLSVYLSISIYLCLSICLSVSISVCLSVSLSVCLSISIYLCLSIYLDLSISVYLSLSVCVSILIYLSLSVWLSRSIYLSLSVCLSRSICLSLSVCLSVLPVFIQLHPDSWNCQRKLKLLRVIGASSYRVSKKRPNNTKEIYAYTKKLKTTNKENKTKAF